MIGSALLNSIPPPERERILRHIADVEIHRGQTLIEAGEDIRCVWFPHDCVTSTIVHTPDGATIEVGIMGLEGMVGLSALFGLEKSNTTVVVQISGRASRMAIGDFIAHVREPHAEAYRILLRYADSFMAMVAQTAACNSLHTIEQRLARWILLTHDRARSVRIGLTQDFISSMLGVRRSSVSLAANGLQSRGAMVYGRGWLEVLDRNALEELSCPCYASLRRLSETLYRPAA